MEGRNIKYRVSFMTNDNSPSRSPCILVGQMQRKLSKSYGKYVTKLTQTDQKLCPMQAVQRDPNSFSDLKHLEKKRWVLISSSMVLQILTCWGQMTWASCYACHLCSTCTLSDSRQSWLSSFNITCNFRKCWVGWELHLKETRQVSSGILRSKLKNIQFGRNYHKQHVILLQPFTENDIQRKGFLEIENTFCQSLGEQEMLLRQELKAIVSVFSRSPKHPQVLKWLTESRNETQSEHEEYLVYFTKKDLVGL